MSTVVALPRPADESRVLRSRAAGLRRQAAIMSPLVGVAYRRRASELELMAWAIRHGPLPTDGYVVEERGAA